MEEPITGLAQITITYNHKGQFEFHITGCSEETKILARTVVAFAQKALGTDKIVIAGNNTLM